MKISMLTTLFPNHSLEDCFHILSRQGYDGIEIWGARPHAYIFDMDDRKCEDILRYQEKYGLQVSMYTPELLSYPYNLVSRDRKERRETVDYLKKGVQAAKNMGTKRMQITCGNFGYSTGRRQAWEWLTEGVKEIAEEAEKQRIDLIVEALSPCESNMVIRCDDIVELKERVGSARIRAMIDLVTPVLMSEEFSEYFEKLPGDVDYIHCIDSDGATCDHMLPGNGVIHFPEVLNTFMDHGYDGWLSGERMTPWDKSLCAHEYLLRMKKYLREAKELQAGEKFAVARHPQT